MALVLHNYFRSSASYRVRIALNLKRLAYEPVAVHLTRNGGEQWSPAFDAINPQHMVPVLDDDGVRIAQSLAIVEYLDERYPDRPLLPGGAADRAYVRGLALHVACDVHPLHNLRVLKYLTGPLQVSDAQKNDWIRHWIAVGLTALEADVSASGRCGAFCHADAPTLADACLVPQMFAARRFEVDLAPYPTLVRIDAACDELDAFRAAHPARQPDAE